MKYTRLYLIILFCFTCTAISVHAQVVAGFTASATSGCAPLVVNFTNTSTGATSYSWDLGNTNTSFQVNASTSYLSPGTYTVKLTATGSSGSNTDSLQITVYAPPVISFFAPKTTICIGEMVSFTNTTNLAASGAGTYSWNFGDGNISVLQNPTHAYTAAGFYNITQTAFNANGCTASLVTNRYINVTASPAPRFATSNNFFCSPPVQVVFTDQTTGNGPYTYTWNFGDNTPTSILSNPIHNYNANGVFNVKELVTDRYGCKDSFTESGAITIHNITATMNTPDTACANLPVLFQNTSTAGNLAVNSVWSFGDGVKDSTQNSFHTYTTGGTYTVKLLATAAGGCTDSITKKVYISQEPAITVTNIPAQPCPAPITIQFNATTIVGASYLWNFADTGVNQSALQNPSHTFTRDTAFPVSVTVHAGGCTYTLIDTVNIYPFAVWVASPGGPHNPFSSCPGKEFTFIGSAKLQDDGMSPPYPYSVASYEYDFGDGSPVSHLPAPTHAYTSSGLYLVHYMITTANGCSARDSTTGYIGHMPVLDSAFASPLHLCSHDTMTIKVYAHGVQPLTYDYTFIPPPSPGFPCGACTAGTNDTIDGTRYSPGIYHPLVYVENYGCISDTIGFTIVVDSPKADFNSVPQCGKASIDFFSTSTGATSVRWFLGDGDTSTAFNPVHTYSGTGTYPVTLVAYNAASGCIDSVGQNVVLIDFKPKILVSDTAICQHDVLTFTASYNIPNPPFTAEDWYVDGQYITMYPPFIYPFNSVGYSSVMLVETDARNCPDTVYQRILVAQPVAAFKATPTNVCVPSAVALTDTSYYLAGTYGTSRRWLFGDGTTATTASAAVNHVYTTAGSFYVKEVITDNIGCMDSVYYLNYISAHKPTANFLVTTRNGCAGDTITFVNTGTPNLQSMYWNFGDGTTSTATMPVHTYSASGTYTVTLAITDTGGCHDTLVRTAYISISKPHAAFVVNNGSGVCVPLIVQFSNTTTGGASYAWTFGNGSTSVATNPTTSYTSPGNYTVQLVAANAYGCKDTATGPVSLYGYSGSFTYNPLAGCGPLHVNFAATVSGIPSVTWDFSDGIVTIPSTSLTAMHTYTHPGKYLPKLVLVDSAGCRLSSLGTDTIIVDRVLAGFTETTPLCVYDVVHFTDTSSRLYFPPNKWQWYFGDGGLATVQNPAHSYITAGSYSVILIAADVSGCKDTVIHTVVIHALPAITATGDTTLCPGDSALVTAQGGVSYAWAAGASCATCNPTYIAVPQQGYYKVTGTDSLGCKNRDSVKVNFKYKTTSYAGPGGQICPGDSLALSDSGAGAYFWVPVTGLSDITSATPTASPTNTTTYLAIARTGHCIPDTNYVAITVNPQPQVTAQGGATVTAGTKVNLQASGAGIVSFLWAPADVLSCYTCADPIAAMQQTTQFTVTATNQYGCEDSAHVLVEVLCDKSQVFIPNTFTPNGDGQNDVFYPRGVGLKTIKWFRIYNRWGQLVFERDDIQLNDERNGWDGTLNGAKPVPDTYIYAIDGICENGSTLDWKGDVTLIE